MTQGIKDGDAATDRLGDADRAGLGDSLMPLWRCRWGLAAATLAGGVVGFLASYLVTPTFLATTTFMPPQAQQSSAVAALAALGPLAGLAGAGPAIRSPAEQYVALMQSVTVSDRIIEKFKLMPVYEVSLRREARKALAGNVRISVGRKDGLISVEVEDKSAERAASMSNAYVDELRQMTSTLALSEAQQRRVFFERQLELARDKLTIAQSALQSSGFNQGALRAEPRAAAESYSKLKAEVTGAETRLMALRSTLSDDTPEVRRQLSILSALKRQLVDLEQASRKEDDPHGYVSRYREFKYQETLFELFARQYELARVDESREGTLIQIVDSAQPAERASAPRRGQFAGTAALACLAFAGLWAMFRAPRGVQRARS